MEKSYENLCKRKTKENVSRLFKARIIQKFFIILDKSVRRKFNGSVRERKIKRSKEEC